MQALQGCAAYGLLFLLLAAPAPARADAAPAQAAAPAAAEPAQRLAEQAASAQLALLHGPADEAAHRVSRHYLWSNERRHDLFFPELAGLGRGYVGVGADQNYTLAAAARADVAWLIDLDAAVVSLHHLYGAAIVASPTAEEFLLLLSGRRADALQSALAARILDERTRAAAQRVHDDYGPLLYQRLRRTYHSKPGGNRANWLNDPSLYAHVRKLALAGRLVPRLADLNGPSTLLQIGEAARAAGVPVRVLYLSNAESWFGYSARLLRNLRALPFDDRSVVLRTVKSQVLRYPAGDVWHFSVQGAQDFVDKLALRRYRSVDVVMADLAPPAGPQPAAGDRPRGLSRVPAGVPERPAAAVEGLVTRPSASPSTPPGDNRPDV